MSTSSIQVHQVDHDMGFNHIFNIRTRVFIEEESVDDEDEYDGFDHLALHYLATYDDIPVGTGRSRRQPVSGKIKFERIAVLADFRSKGIGTAILQKMLADVPLHTYIYLHSLVETVPFFEKNGFVSEGDEFEEAGKAHVKMVLGE